MNEIRFVRLLRTSSSERFLLKREDDDVGAVDFHYLDGGCVAATLILLTTLSKDNVEALISRLDEMLLPNASRENGNVTFTVVRGEIMGSFEGATS